jgi:hypothetical protein
LFGLLNSNNPMKNEIEIPIYIRPRTDSRILFVPFEVVKIPLGTTVKWRIENDNDFKSFIKRANLFSGFQVYFPGISPFSWHTQELLKFNPFSTPPQTDLVVARGQTNSVGDYKYGIKVRNTIDDEDLDDEDPILIVY